MKKINLQLQQDVHEFEMNLKGYWPEVKVSTPDGYSYELNFFSTGRLIEDMYFSESNQFIYERGLVILSEISIEQMSNVAQNLWESGYFNELLPLELSPSVKLSPNIPFRIETYHMQNLNKEEILYYSIHIQSENYYLGCGVTDEFLKYYMRHDRSFFAEPGTIVSPKMNSETLETGIRSLLQYDSTYFSHLKPWDEKVLDKLRYSQEF